MLVRLKTRPLIAVSTLLLFLLGLQMLHFTVGFRLTADDAMFLQYLHRGWSDVWQAGQAFALLTGRIGHFVMTPLNALGAFWAGYTELRWLMVGLYFLVFLAFSFYASRLLARGSLWVTAFFFLVMLSLHPLAYDHMPPTAYPLQNTLPFLLLILLRSWLLKQTHWPWIALVPFYLLQAGLMLVSEYVLVLASVMMAVEHLARAWQPDVWHTKQRLLRLPIRVDRFLADALLAVIVLLIYLGFRWAFPTQYPGNSIDGLGSLQPVVQTMYSHVLSGISLTRLRLDAQPSTLMFAALVAGLTALATWQVLPRLTWPSRLAALVIAAVTLFFMLYMTFPLAMTQQAQERCLVYGSCGYLDSRSAFLGIGVLFWCGVAFFKLQTTRWRRAGVSLLLASFAAVTFAHNQRIAKDMALRVQPWYQAQTLACQLPAGAAVTPQRLEAIDPHRLVPLHGYEDPRFFWLEHLNGLRAAGDCGPDLQQPEAALHSPFLMRFTQPGFVRVGDVRTDDFFRLQQGWSHPELGSIWSEGPSSRLMLDLTDPALAQVTELVIFACPYWGPSVQYQHIKISIEGEHQKDWFIESQQAAQVCQMTLPIAQWVGSSFVLELEYHHLRDHHHPHESADPRALALSLQRIEFREGSSQ